jgi:hypothetical protein
MKYKLYAISDSNNKYFKEIRGIRYAYQYHLLPPNATWIDKEYDNLIEREPDLFLKNELGRDINFAKYKANNNYTDIIEITIDELKTTNRFKKHKKEEKLKKLLNRKERKEKRALKRSLLVALQDEHPELVTEILEEKDKIDNEDQLDTDIE